MLSLRYSPTIFVPSLQVCLETVNIGQRNLTYWIGLNEKHKFVYWQVTYDSDVTEFKLPDASFQTKTALKEQISDSPLSRDTNMNYCKCFYVTAECVNRQLSCQCCVHSLFLLRTSGYKIRFNRLMLIKCKLNICFLSF